MIHLKIIEDTILIIFLGILRTISHLNIYDRMEL